MFSIAVHVWCLPTSKSANTFKLVSIVQPIILRIKLLRLLCTVIVSAASSTNVGSYQAHPTSTEYFRYLRMKCSSTSTGANFIIPTLYSVCIFWCINVGFVMYHRNPSNSANAFTNLKKSIEVSGFLVLFVALSMNVSMNGQFLKASVNTLLI